MRSEYQKTSMTTPASTASTPLLRTPNSALRTQEVFSINFLRHEILPLPVRRTLASLAVVYLLAHAGIAVGLIGAGVAAQGEWRQIQADINGQAPSASAIRAMRRDMDVLHQQAGKDLAALNAMATLERQKFPVGAKLASLTKTLPARTWITGLSGKRDNHTLTVQAAYLTDPDAPYDLPTKAWIDALKADPAFSRGLKRLEMGASSRKHQGSAELFTFELIAEWAS